MNFIFFFLQAYSKVPPPKLDDFGQLNNRPRVFRFTNSEKWTYNHISFSTKQKEKNNTAFPNKRWSLQKCTTELHFCTWNFLKKYTHYFQEFKFQYFVENNEFFVGKSFRLAFRSLFNQYVYLFMKAHVMFSKNQKQKKGMSFSKNNMCFLSYLYFLRNPFFAGKQ